MAYDLRGRFEDRSKSINPIDGASLNFHPEDYGRFLADNADFFPSTDPPIWYEMILRESKILPEGTAVLVCNGAVVAMINLESGTIQVSMPPETARVRRIR